MTSLTVFEKKWPNITKKIPAFFSSIKAFVYISEYTNILMFLQKCSPIICLISSCWTFQFCVIFLPWAILTAGILILIFAAQFFNSKKSLSKFTSHFFFKVWKTLIACCSLQQSQSWIVQKMSIWITESRSARVLDMGNYWEIFVWFLNASFLYNVSFFRNFWPQCAINTDIASCEDTVELKSAEERMLGFNIRTKKRSRESFKLSKEKGGRMGKREELNPNAMLWDFNGLTMAVWPFLPNQCFPSFRES